MKLSSLVRILAPVLVALACLPGPLRAQAKGDPALLRASYTQLQPALARNAYGRPLHIESSEADGNLKGDVHAIVSHPFAQVADALSERAHWCEVLILPFNVKQCLAPKGADALTVKVGRKFDQPLKDAYGVDFKYRVLARTADHLAVELSADKGPLGTRDYRITLEAVPIDAQRSFLRLSYSYGYGMAARMALQGYLATVGSDKVGFSVAKRNERGQPVYVGGVRGVVERNAMRYFLAVESYLDVPDDDDRRLRQWFTATERYPRQLHEMEQAEYVAMKQREVRRQRDGA